MKTFSCSESFAMSVTDGDGYDIYILDVEMPGMNGMELAGLIRSVQPAAIIIFVTYYIDYAPQGFKVNAFRFFITERSYAINLSFVERADGLSH